MPCSSFFVTDLSHITHVCNLREITINHISPIMHNFMRFAEIIRKRIFGDVMRVLEYEDTEDNVKYCNIISILAKARMPALFIPDIRISTAAPIQAYAVKPYMIIRPLIFPIIAKAKVAEMDDPNDAGENVKYCDIIRMLADARMPTLLKPEIRVIAMACTTNRHLIVRPLVFLVFPFLLVVLLDVHHEDGTKFFVLVKVADLQVVSLQQIKQNQTI